MWENIDMTEVGSPEASIQVSKIVTDALKENPGLRKTPQPELEALTRQTLVRMGQFEQAGRNLAGLLPKTPDEARRIKAVWVLSGPGTYFAPQKEDRYKDLSWAEFMDRRRINVAGWIWRRINELGGQPYIIYNGRPDENEALLQALGQEGVVIPKERVHIIDAPIDKTVDQVTTFSLPSNLEHLPGDIIGIVTHAPHMARLLHMLNKFKPGPFQDGATVKIFPAPTRQEGIQEYAEQETRGLLYYVFLANQATPEPYPYTL